MTKSNGAFRLVHLTKKILASIYDPVQSQLYKELMIRCQLDDTRARQSGLVDHWGSKKDKKEPEPVLVKAT